MRLSSTDGTFRSYSHLVLLRASTALQGRHVRCHQPADDWRQDIRCVHCEDCRSHPSASCLIDLQNNVQSTDEPGLGVTVPFTPPPPAGGSSAPPPAGASPTTATNRPTPSNTSASTTPTTSSTTTAGAGMINPRSAVVLGFVGLVASLVL